MMMNSMIALAPIFMAATMGMSGGRHVAPPGPQTIGFALQGSEHYCLKNSATEFRIVARNNPSIAVASVNRPFSDKPVDGVVFQVYNLEQKTLAGGVTQQTYTPVNLPSCAA